MRDAVTRDLSEAEGGAGLEVLGENGGLFLRRVSHLPEEMSLRRIGLIRGDPTGEIGGGLFRSPAFERVLHLWPGLRASVKSGRLCRWRDRRCRRRCRSSSLPAPRT